MTCQNCKYASAVGTTTVLEQPDFFECRRYPGQVVMAGMMAKQNLQAGGMIPVPRIEVFHPRHSPTFECGEFTPTLFGQRGS